MGSMWPFSFIGCFGPLLGLLLLAESIRMLWVTLMWPSKPREAACGRCGYSVAGLSDPRCPECGGDLRVEGVSTPLLVLRYRGSLVGAILAWTVIAMCVGMIATGVVGVLSYRYTAAATVAGGGQVWTTPLYPNSKAYTQASLVSSTTWNTPGATQVIVELTLKDASTWKLLVDGTGATGLTDPNGNAVGSNGTLGAGTAAALFKAAGLNTADAAIAAEAAELDTIVKIASMSPYTMVAQMNVKEFVAAGPSFKQTGGPVAGSSTSWAREVLPLLAVAGTAVLVWGLGIVGVVKRRRKMLARGTVA